MGIRDFDLIPLFIRQTAQIDHLKSDTMLENYNFIWKAAINGLF